MGAKVVTKHVAKVRQPYGAEPLSGDAAERLKKDLKDAYASDSGFGVVILPPGIDLEIERVACLVHDDEDLDDEDDCDDDLDDDDEDLGDDFDNDGDE